MPSYNFDHDTTTPLCEIMGRNKSDKGHAEEQKIQHNYTTFYHSIFKHIRNNNLRVFELGLGTNDTNIPSNMGKNARPGASLYGWEEYFPNSKIFGADIDTKILFETKRIKTYFCDQTNPKIIKDMWNNSELLENFDIIIEDGLHTFLANVCFFENSIHKLKKGGYYIIEDIRISEIKLFNKKLEEWKNKYPYLSFELLKIHPKSKPQDNNLLVIYKNN
jgi:hypothetical protein